MPQTPQEKALHVKKGKHDSQEYEDKLTAASLKRYKTKSKGVRMTRSILG